MAQMGFRSPPDPVIEWSVDGQPQILFGQADLSAAELRQAAIRRRLARNADRPANG